MGAERENLRVLWSNVHHILGCRVSLYVVTAQEDQHFHNESHVLPLHSFFLWTERLLFIFSMGKKMHTSKHSRN